MAQHIDQSSHLVCTWLETWMVLPWDLKKSLLFQFSHLSLSFAGCVSDIFWGLSEIWAALVLPVQGPGSDRQNWAFLSLPHSPGLEWWSWNFAVQAVPSSLLTIHFAVFLSVMQSLTCNGFGLIQELGAETLAPGVAVWGGWFLHSGTSEEHMRV